MATLALIPGLVSDSIVWAPLADAVAHRMSVHAADVSRTSSIPDMAESILAATEGDLIAVGHSMGGRVAMEMARIAPDRVRGLVLANTGHHPKREGEEIRRQQMIDLGHRSMQELADEWLPPMVDPARLTDAEVIASLRAMALRAGPDMHERQIRALINRPNATAYMAELGCPILLVAARHDSWSPIVQHQEIADAAPDTELVIIEDAGHFAPVERPAEVTDVIIGWLTRRFGGFDA
jgi:pimeloyl-ACP methyl ester carboxylesterase